MEGIVKYNQFKRDKEDKTGIVRILIKRQIIKFSIISMLTGVISTTVVFWMPAYISQYLGFSPEMSASIFTVATFVISATAFVSIGWGNLILIWLELMVICVFISFQYKKKTSY